MSKIIEVIYKGETNEVIIDDDIELPAKLHKKDNERNYYFMFIKGKKVYLHRWLVGVTDRRINVDHRNNDKSDNRKCNLRVCTFKENMQNRINKGYYYSKQHKRYVAQITVEGKHISLGIHDTTEEAQKAYRKAHVEAFGEFSPYYGGNK